MTQHEIKFIGPILLFVLVLALLALAKPKFVQTSGKLSILKSVGIALVLALVLAAALYFIPM
jgi:ribose/xylose/arabinose/galactoside ABC-type transport system permease subunit